MRQTFICFAFAIVFSGCCRTREVLVEIPAPPPTIVTQTDTFLVHVAPPPPTPPDTVEVEVTRPIYVTEYIRPRPDSSRATPIHGISVDSLYINIYGNQRDWRFLTPMRGERTWIKSEARDSLTSVIEGTPRTQYVELECPTCPTCIYEDSTRSKISLWLHYLGFFALGIAVAGAVLFVYNLISFGRKS